MTTTRPSVFLAAPGYGNQTAAAGRGIWRARRDMSSVTVEHIASSLLAAGFNGLWVSALNQATERGLDYFAMIHSDIGPTDFWLDDLIEEMEREELDVLGVAVPIKDQRGLTSLAVDGDGTWRPKCRLTSKEVMSLPPTFTSEDVGGPLLINTGLWVCRFDLEWCRKVHFTINDRIIVQPNGKYLAEVEPEDWYFSRLCHELGLKIGATRKIKLMHRGEMDFFNQDAHGAAYDEQYAAGSSVANIFPFEVPGWLSPDEGRTLARYAEDHEVLEIGSYCGKSTVCLARTANAVTCVDYFDGRGTQMQVDTFGAFSKTIKRYEVADKVTTHHPDKELPKEHFDLVFIDGDHEAASVQADIEKAIESLKPDGLLIFHDYQLHDGEITETFDPGVNEAVNELLADGGRIIERIDTLAVVQPPVCVPS